MQETALEWLKRTNLNRRRAIHNPIHYPTISITSDESSDISVEPSQISQLAAETFLHRMGRYQKIKARMNKWRQLRDEKQGKLQSSSSDELDELVINCFPLGTGISFLDSILINQSLNDRSKQSNDFSDKSNKRIVELTGKSGTGKTRVLMTLAANFVAATSTLFLRKDALLGTRDNDMSNDENYSMPQVVIIDPEFGVHLDILEHLVRIALIRRWNVTEKLRNRLCEESSHTNVSNVSIENQGTDLLLFERELSSALQRVHIYHPRDVAGEYVATLECIHQSLDRREEGHQHSMSQPGPTTLLLMDSTISAFEHVDKMYDSLPSGQGLSGRIEFIRQLDRITSKHDVVVLATRNTRGKNVGGPSSCEGWNKIVTERVPIKRVIPGTKEDKEGFTFVALIPERSKPNDLNCTGFTPFSITDDGLL